VLPLWLSSFAALPLEDETIGNEISEINFTFWGSNFGAMGFPGDSDNPQITKRYNNYNFCF